MRSFFFFFIFLFLYKGSVAQEQQDFSGIITPSDFNLSSPLINSETDAVVLKDSGHVTLEGYEYGFRTVFYRYKRIKILNKRGLDAARVTLSYSTEDNGGRKLKSLKAFTYNLENGRVNKTSVEKKDFFLEKEDGDINTEKFAFPNAVPGSIIEYEYTIKRATNTLPSWYFQSSYPVLQSSFALELPDIFNYIIQLTGKKYLINKKTDSVKKVLVAGNTWYTPVIYTINWKFQNIPPMREEPFTTTIENYIGCLKFQLSAIPDGPYKTVRVLGDWQSVSDRLLNSERFGIPINKNEAWLKKLTDGLVRGSESKLPEAKKLYSYVRDHFRVDDQDFLMSPGVVLKDICLAGHGNVAEINLLLIAFLRSQNMEADPVILATRKSGLTNANYPILDNFNYLVCRLSVDGKVYFLDASSASEGFGRLPVKCYNGHARVVTRNNYPVYFSPDSLKESSSTSVFLYNTEKGKQMKLEYTHIAGMDESRNIRDSLKRIGEGYSFRGIADGIPFKRMIDSSGSDSLTNPDFPVRLYCKMHLLPGNDSLIYFNPMLDFHAERNPFISATRLYPVQLPYTSDKIFILNMEVPDGYEVDELPQSTRLLLNATDGIYEYLIQSTGRKILFKSHMALRKAIFEPEEYAALRGFFASVIKKQNEMIIFRKIHAEKESK